MASQRRYEQRGERQPHSRQPIQEQSVNHHQLSPLHQGLWKWIPHIPQSADDGTVVNRVKEVFFLTEQFADNFYSTHECDGNIDAGLLHQVNRSPLHSTTTLCTHLNQTRSQLPAIKHILLALLLDAINFDNTQVHYSLLPRECESYRTLIQTRAMSTGALINTPHLQTALTSFRILSTYICAGAAGSRECLDARAQIAEHLTADIEQALRPWARNDKTRDDRYNMMCHILEKTGSLGTFLFAQPSVFIFDWEMTQSDRARHPIAISPSLLKVFDDDGQRLHVARCMIRLKPSTIYDDRLEVRKDAAVGSSQLDRAHQQNLSTLESSQHHIPPRDKDGRKVGPTAATYHSLLSTTAPHSLNTDTRKASQRIHHSERYQSTYQPQHESQLLIERPIHSKTTSNVPEVAVEVCLPPQPGGDTSTRRGEVPRRNPLPSLQTMMFSAYEDDRGNF